MPELPEVQTTVDGLNQHICGLIIRDVWTNYNSPYHHGKDTIKDPAYFGLFKKEILGKKVFSISRRAKNVLIHLSDNKTILIHMKMTGHLLYGRYKFVEKNTKDPWEPISPDSLNDPFNRRVRFVLVFSNAHQLALSDTRKFAKVTLLATKSLHESIHLVGIGPEPLEKAFTYQVFLDRLNLRPQGKIKLTLMDQTIIAGIGNIYADESLWRAGIHPKELVKNIPQAKLGNLYKAVRETLSHGIKLGGDSMSDYRNVKGEKGEFQENHRAYRRTGQKCDKRGCPGHISRIVLGGRSTHFCNTHQEYKKGR